MKLSEIQTQLALLAGQALRRGDEDPEVVLYDRYGGVSEIGEVRLDWIPETFAEAEDDVRHPRVELIPAGAPPR